MTVARNISCILVVLLGLLVSQLWTARHLSEKYTRGEEGAEGKLFSQRKSTASPQRLKRDDNIMMTGEPKSKLSAITDQPVGGLVSDPEDEVSVDTKGVTSGDKQNEVNSDLYERRGDDLYYKGQKYFSKWSQAVEEKCQELAKQKNLHPDHYLVRDWKYGAPPGCVEYVGRGPDGPKNLLPHSVVFIKGCLKDGCLEFVGCNGCKRLLDSEGSALPENNKEMDNDKKTEETTRLANRVASSDGEDENKTVIRTSVARKRGKRKISLDKAPIRKEKVVTGTTGTVHQVTTREKFLEVGGECMRWIANHWEVAGNRITNKEDLVSKCLEEGVNKEACEEMLAGYEDPAKDKKTVFVKFCDKLFNAKGYGKETLEESSKEETLDDTSGTFKDKESSEMTLEEFSEGKGPCMTWIKEHSDEDSRVSDKDSFLTQCKEAGVSQNACENYLAASSDLRGTKAVYNALCEEMFNARYKPEYMSGSGSKSGPGSGQDMSVIKRFRDGPCMEWLSHHEQPRDSPDGKIAQKKSFLDDCAKAKVDEQACKDFAESLGSQLDADQKAARYDQFCKHVFDALKDQDIGDADLDEDEDDDIAHTTRGLVKNGTKAVLNVGEADVKKTVVSEASDTETVTQILSTQERSIAIPTNGELSPNLNQSTAEEQ